MAVENLKSSHQIAKMTNKNKIVHNKTLNFTIVQHRTWVRSRSSKSQDIAFFGKLIKLTSLVDQNIQKSFNAPRNFHS